MQFGFRKGKLTVDAIQAVQALIENAEKASKKKRRGGRDSALW